MPAQYPSALVTVTQLPTSRVDTTASVANHIADHDNAALELIAIETELGVLPKGNQSDVKTRLQGWGAEMGGEALRAAMFNMAGATRTLKAQNFQLWYPFSPTLANDGMTNQRNSYMAIFWPGGAPTGIVWMQAVAGAYTDTGTHSGFQLLGGGAGAPVTSATTTLTRITNSNTTATPANMWQAAAGLNFKAFAGSVASLAAGIYYVNFFYSQTTEATNPNLTGLASLTGNDYVNLAGYGSPSGFPLFAIKAGDTDLQSSALISGLSITATAYLWAGLY